MGAGPGLSPTEPIMANADRHPGGEALKRIFYRAGWKAPATAA